MANEQSRKNHNIKHPIRAATIWIIIASFFNGFR